MTKEERRRLKASIRRGARYQTPQEIEEKMFQDKLEKIANEFDITPDQVYEELVIKKN
tara:strand:+ start:95 stop:268 length:174 start_codon:yes stop_codon:yes gene_type:complete